MGLAARIQIDDRFGERREVAIPGTIRKEAAPIDVEIENLSITGFRATLGSELQQGDSITIGAAWMGRRAASVVWAKHPSYGFVFDQPLSEAEFASADTVSNVAPLAIRSPLEMSAQLAATGRLDPAARPERMGMAKSLAMATAGVLIAVGEGLRKRAK